MRSAVALLVLVGCLASMASATSLSLSFGWFSASPSLPAPKSDPSYGDLAIQVVVNSFNRMATDLALFDNNTIAGGPYTKDLRHLIEQGRDYADLFCFAFPTPTDPSQNDTFLLVRGDYDAGHSLVGDFDDMAKYNKSGPIEKQRLKILAWKQQLLDAGKMKKYLDYLSSPTSDKLYPRPKSELSPEFWQDVPDTLPSLMFSGLGNIAALVDAYLDIAANRWNTSQYFSIDDLLVASNMKFLHTVRKQIRSYNYTASFFPNVWINSSPPLVAMNQTMQFYLELGVVVSALIEYQHYIGNNNTKKAAQQKQIASAQWTFVLQQQQTLPYADTFFGLLKTIKAGVIVPSGSSPAPPTTSTPLARAVSLAKYVADKVSSWFLL